jgi:hypothetical protein
MISQAGLIKMANARFSERTITISSTLLLSICFGVYAIISDSTSLFVLCVPMVALSTLFQLVNSAQIVRASPPELKGTLVAVDMVRNRDRCADFDQNHTSQRLQALFSGMRIWTPTFGAYLFANYGYASLGMTSGAAILMVAVLILVSARWRLQLWQLVCIVSSLQASGPTVHAVKSSSKEE